MLARKVLNQFAKFASAYRRTRAKLLGVSLNGDCRLGPDLDFNCATWQGKAGSIEVGDHGWIERGTVLWAFGGHIRLQRSVFVGPYCVIYGHGGVDIGEETLISMHCCILSSNHSVPSHGSIIRQQSDILLPTRIGRDVWLGAGVRVLGGVTIGDGCVVGAGAVVTRELPPYSIAVGVPARVIGQRSK